MSNLKEETRAVSDEQASEESRWIERLTDACSDFESIGGEDAAGLGL